MTYKERLIHEKILKQDDKGFKTELLNVSLTGNSNASYHKKDFSIQNIEPKKIKECVLNILKEKE